jgi:hypothetical protein
VLFVVRSTPRERGAIRRLSERRAVFGRLPPSQFGAAGSKVPTAFLTSLAGILGETPAETQVHNAAVRALISSVRARWLPTLPGALAQFAALRSDIIV